MKISRRDLLKFAAGSAAGILFTPVPYKALDDAAIWTQNWPWIPQPSRGSNETRFTTCSLCPAGCGVRARCVAGQPVSLTGAAGHPLSRGTLCPTGLGGHHLAFHPARILRPVRRVNSDAEAFEPIELDEAVGRIADAVRSGATPGATAILDQQPGRVISGYYRQLLAGLPGGVYITLPGAEQIPASTLAAMSAKPVGPMGFDLDNARTVISFGVPLLDGWEAPGKLSGALARREAGNFTIIQCEPRYSRTAALADQWVPLRPGTETALALSIASVLVTESLYDRTATRSAGFASGEYQELLKRFAPDAAAAVTGLSADVIRGIAHTLAAGQPAVAVWGNDPGSGPIGREESVAIAGLNILLGSVGRKGGIIPRRETPGTPEGGMAPIRDLRDIADGSIKLLILDAGEAGHALPWPLVKRKLAVHNALVVSLSPFNAGLTRHAEYVIPAPVPYETWSDVPTPPSMPTASLGISAPLMKAPTESIEPIAFLEKLAAATNAPLKRTAAGATLEEDLKLRVQAVYAGGKGTLFKAADKSETPLAGIASADDLWSALIEGGGCWTDAPLAEKPGMEFSLLGASEATRMMILSTRGTRIQPLPEFPLILLPFGWRTTAGSGQCSPLMTKLFQETSVRPSTNQAWIHPRTASEAGLIDNSTAVLSTTAGVLTLYIHTDTSVMPGVIQVAVGPEMEALNGRKEPLGFISLVAGTADGTWRVLQAKVAGA